MRRIGPLVVACAFALTGCATTVIDTAPTTTATPTTTTIPNGSTEELLAELDARLTDLSAATFAQDKPKARTILADVEAIWFALEPQARATSDQLVDDLSRIVELARSSVVRNRPAEADKAARFLQLLLG